MNVSDKLWNRRRSLFAAVATTTKDTYRWCDGENFSSTFFKLAALSLETVRGLEEIRKEKVLQVLRHSSWQVRFFFSCDETQRSFNNSICFLLRRIFIGLFSVLSIFFVCNMISIWHVLRWFNMCSSTNLSFLSVTDQGKVLKTINAASADDSSRVTSVVIEELDVLSKPEPIRNLKIIRTMQYGEF